MEAFWFFNLNGVAVAAASNETYNISGKPVKPVNKMIEVKPGMLCSIIGPYEGISQHQRYLTERFKLNPALTIEEAMEDIRWMISKKELDANPLHDAMKKLTEALKNPHLYDVNEAITNMMNIEAFRKIADSPNDEEHKKKLRERNRLLNQVRLIEALPDTFNIHTLVINPSEDEVVLSDRKYKYEEPPSLDQWGLQEWKPANTSLGNAILDLRKEYLQKRNSLKDPIAITKQFRQLIAQLDEKYNPEPVPLQFMQVGNHTGYRWQMME